MVKDAKFYVRVSSELNDKLQMLADNLGMSKSGLAAYFIGQKVQEELIKLSSIRKMSEDPTYMAEFFNKTGATEAMLGQISMDDLVKKLSRK